MDDASPNPQHAQRIPPLPQDGTAPKLKSRKASNPLFLPILLGIMSACIASQFFRIYLAEKSLEQTQKIQDNYSIELSQLARNVQKKPLTHSNTLARISERHGLELAILKNKWDTSVLESKQEHKTKISQINNSHREEFQNHIRSFKAVEQDSRLWDGSKARALHESEWQDRSARNPRFAVTPMEKAMLQMQATSTNGSLPFQEILKQVAALASPPGSRIDIKETSQGYFIRVAFALSKINPDERGAVTKHPNVESLRNEIEKCSAEVIRDLYEYCGTKRIAKIAVSCNHATRSELQHFAQNEQEMAILSKQSRPYMSCPFRCSIDNSTASQVASWKSTPTSKVITMMKIEKDSVRDIKITKSDYRDGDSSLAQPTDPPLPLRFD